MKIIRWLLSHFFLILLIVTVIYGYMFWGNLAGENTPAGKALAYLSEEFVDVEEFINAVKAKQAKLTEEKKQSVENKPLAASPDTATAIPQEKRNIEQLPVSISYSHNQMRIKQNSDGEIESSAEAAPQNIVVNDNAQSNAEVESSEKPILLSPQEKTVKSEPQPLEQTSVQADVNVPAAEDKFVSAKVEQQLNNVDDKGRVVNPSLPGEAIRAIWVTARKSFYQRKYDLSEKSYQQVIDNTTDNFDAYGELGNVYFNQGKTEQAAAAYFEAASILVRKGQIKRAVSLLGLLRRLDNDKATDLKKLIDSVVS